MELRGKRKKLSKEVADGIIDMIRNGKIGRDERIPTENKLEQLFNVSRTSVREAIRSLVAIGVLETRPGVGTFVRGAIPGPLRYFSGEPNPIPVLQEMLEARRILEPEITFLAAIRRTSEELEELERCVVTLECAVPCKVRPPEDLGFHLALANATNNSTLADLSSLIVRFYDRDPLLPNKMDVEGHIAIFNAVRDRDPARARQKMIKHLDELRKRYVEKENK